MSQLSASGNFRHIPAAESAAGVVDLSSNDYLGLAVDTDLRRDFMRGLTVENFLPSSSASRLLCGLQDDYQSLIGRVGVRAGLEFPNEKSTFYARVSGAWEMMGEDEYHAVADAGRVESFRTELDGGWSEYAVGANFKLAPNAFVWADLEKIAGGDIRENYRYTISARRVW